MTVQSRRLLLLTTVIAGALLSGCASLLTKPEEAVAQRANARWQALLKGDMEKAYSFNTPGYRAVVNAQAFRARTGIAGRWHAAEVVRVECDRPDRCKAVIRLEFSALIGGRSTDRISTHFDETWLLEDGTWWIFQKI